MDRKGMDMSLLVKLIQLNQISSLKIFVEAELEGLGGIQALANLLRHNSSVTQLDLTNGLKIGGEGVKYIAQLLQHNTRILEIDLWKQ
jgi:hypothetical protein